MRSRWAASMLAAALCCGTMVGRAAGGQAPGRVTGQVTVWSTGRPVAGAIVSIRGFGATVASGHDGRFAFPQTIPLKRPDRRIVATVAAPGYGRWTISGVPVYPNETLQLSVRLRSTAYHDRVLTPAERMAHEPPA